MNRPERSDRGDVQSHCLNFASPCKTGLMSQFSTRIANVAKLRSRLLATCQCSSDAVVRERRQLTGVAFDLQTGRPSIDRTSRCISDNSEDDQQNQDRAALPPMASLLGLPRELRDMIFEYVCGDWAEQSNPFQLLRTCQQVRHEVAKPLCQKTLLRIDSEHWPDQEYFYAKYLSKIPAESRHFLSNLAVPLPRGLPFDRYGLDHIPLDLANFGIRLKTLVIYSAHGRPLPQTSIYGGLIEANFCQWLKSTLYSMPSLRHICLLNYESPTPPTHDMPSPRLIKMLRSSLYEDVLADCGATFDEEICDQSPTDSLESSMSRCTADEKIYRIHCSKLGWPVEIAFRSEAYLADYGLKAMARDMLNKAYSLDSVEVPKHALSSKFLSSHSVHSAGKGRFWRDHIASHLYGGKEDKLAV